MAKLCSFTLNEKCLKQLERFKKDKGWNKSATVRLAIDFLDKHIFPAVDIAQLRIGRPRK